MIFSKTGNINAAAIGFIRKAIFSFATISVTPRCKIATRGYAYSAIYILFCISDCVAVSNPYRLIFTKGINQINLKDGRDLIEVYRSHMIYAMTPSNNQPCAKKEVALCSSSKISI